jgi:hypothetical protein
VVWDSGDGFEGKAPTTGGSRSCPDARGRPDDYSADFVHQLLPALRARGVQRIDCVDWAWTQGVRRSRPDREWCRSMAGGRFVTALRGQALVDLRKALRRCGRPVEIISGDGATNLTAAAMQTLESVGDADLVSMTYIGFDAGDESLPSHGRQAWATGADAALAMWAAAGQAQRDGGTGGSWAADDITRSLQQGDLQVESPTGSTRPVFHFPAGERRARAEDGHLRPVVLCTIKADGPGVSQERCRPVGGGG